MPKRDNTPKAVSKNTTPQKQVKPSSNTKVEDGAGSVQYTVSITKNLDNFESLKIQAGITIPHGASDEYMKELDDLVTVARDVVVSRLMSDLKNLAADTKNAL